MALTRTAAQLVSDVRNRADHLVGTFRDDATLRRYLSESCRSLVSWLTADYEEMYWAKLGTLPTTANQQTSALPADYWKMIAMRVTLDSTRQRIRRADLDDIDSEAINVGGWSAGIFPRARIIGRTLYWVPIPRAVHTVSLFYVPTAIFFDVGNNPISELTADTDYFDGIFGWETWVVLDAAIKLLSDEKKDVSALLLELGRREEEIRTAAANQVTDEPARIRDRWGDDADSAPLYGRMPPGGWY